MKISSLSPSGSPENKDCSYSLSIRKRPKPKARSSTKKRKQRSSTSLRGNAQEKEQLPEKSVNALFQSSPLRSAYSSNGQDLTPKNQILSISANQASYQPRKRRKTDSTITTIFKVSHNLLEPYDQGNLFKETLNPLAITGTYKVSAEQQEVCIKQPPQYQSCGPCAVLMILTHLIVTHKMGVHLEENFWRWYFTQELSNVKKLIDKINELTNLKELGLRATGIKLYKGNIKNSDIQIVKIKNYADHPAKIIKKTIENTGLSIIASITNEKISGHWIVIDKIDEQFAYIRDPFSGNSYNLSLDELYKNWEEEDMISVLMIEKLG